MHGLKWPIISARIVPLLELTLCWSTQVGSMSFYDNRACQHYPVGDYWPHKRRLDRVTLLDKQPERRRPYYNPPQTDQTGACGYNRSCAHKYVGKYQSCMV